MNVRNIAILAILISHIIDLSTTRGDISDILFRFHVIIIFVSIVALISAGVNVYVGLAINVFDSSIFSLSIGWFVVVYSEGLRHSALFASINWLLLFFLLVVDALTIVGRKAIFYDEETLTVASDQAIAPNQSQEDTSQVNTDDIELGNLALTTNSLCARYNFTVSDSYIKEGFKVILSKLPPLLDSSDPLGVRTGVRWDEFSSIHHVVDSSSCHIYRAVWTRRNQPVILKLIKEDRMQSALSMSEFEAEACILGRVRHPNIINLLGSGHIPRPFLVLEMLEGGTLAHSLGIRTDSLIPGVTLSKRSFSFSDSLEAALALASSMKYLHQQWNSSIHVIHRDLKPDNIGWSNDGVMKVFDFGLCVCVRTNSEDSSECYKMTGNTGTLRYMAPEVALGQPYNSSVDVYSFAIIVWQICKGKVPFASLGKKAFLSKVVSNGLRPPLDPTWPLRFKALLQLCWHQNKDSRPDFSFIVSELEALLDETRRNKVGFSVWCLQCCRTLVPVLKIIRPLVILGAVVLLIAGCSISGHDESSLGGLVLVVLSSGLLYLNALSYWKWYVQERISKKQKFGALQRTSTGAATNQAEFDSSSFNPIGQTV